MNNSAFQETMENVIEHRDIKLLQQQKKEEIIQCQNQIIILAENSLAREIRKTQVLMNKSTYLGLSTLDFCKPVMYEF